MEIRERNVNESHLKEVVRLVRNRECMINLDVADVIEVMVGKKGVMYEARQEPGEDNKTFMRRCFNELSNKQTVKGCGYMLLSIGASAEEPLTMEDVDTISEFFFSFEKVESKWGFRNNEEGVGMTLMLLCTNKIG